MKTIYTTFSTAGILSVSLHVRQLSWSRIGRRFRLRRPAVVRTLLRKGLTKHRKERLQAIDEGSHRAAKSRAERSGTGYCEGGIAGDFGRIGFRVPRDVWIFCLESLRQPSRTYQ